MFPGMQWVVLSTDVEFCEDVRRMLGNVEADVYGAATWEEYERLQAEGVVSEMLVVDPVFRLC